MAVECNQPTFYAEPKTGFTSQKKDAPFSASHFLDSKITFLFVL